MTLKTSIREILGSVLRRGLTRNLGKDTFSIDQATLAILQVVRECVPKEKDIRPYNFDYEDGLHSGWNACIDEINKALGAK